jgi:hypothetical protein
VSDGERGAGGAGRGYLGRGTGSRGAGGGGNGRGWGPTDGPGEPAGLRRVPGLRWLGTLSAKVALYILFGAALLGVLGTLLTGSEPGKLLSYLLIIGSVVAAVGIRRRSLYLLIPLPALTFFVCAVITGAVKDSSIDTSKTELGLTFLQWIAGVFFSMCAATILVLLIGGGRWLLSRQLVAGQFGLSSSVAAAGDGSAPRPTQPPGQRADRDRRPPADRAPWAAPWDRDDSGGQRAKRPGDARDPWGDRRQPPGRQPPGRQPPDRAQPGSQPPTRAQPGAQPPDRRQPGSGDQDPWSQRDKWNRQGSRKAGNPLDGRDRPDPRDQWGNR